MSRWIALVLALVMAANGLFMLAQVVRFVPDHYVRLTSRILEMIQGLMAQGAGHG